MKFLRWVYEPTLQERWKAFNSIYRALYCKCVYADGAIAEAARVVFSGEQLKWYNFLRAQEVLSGSVPLWLRLIAFKARKRGVFEGEQQ